MSDTENDTHGKMARYKWHGSTLAEFLSSVPVDTNGKNLYCSYYYSRLTVAICLTQ